MSEDERELSQAQPVASEVEALSTGEAAHGEGR